MKRTLLVDPPRAGVDGKTLQLMQKFDHVLYISCNPSTCVQNIKSLGEDWKVEKLALFDQFPYTHHLECGVLLRRLAD